MSVKESNLVTVGSADITSSDFVRVLDGDSSRKQTLTDFASSIGPELIEIGFVSNANNALSVAVRTAVANSALLLTDRVVLVDTSAADVAINLPSALSVWDATTNVSQQFTMKKITTDVNKVNIVPSGVETIDGNTAYNIIGPSLGAVTLVSDGANWFVVGV